MKTKLRLEKAWGPVSSDKWRRLMRLASDWEHESEASVVCAVTDAGGVACATFVAGRGELDPKRAGELCSILCHDFMAPFVRMGLSEFLEGFSQVGIGREFGAKPAGGVLDGASD